MGQERQHCTAAFEDLGSQTVQLQKGDLVKLPGLISSDVSRWSMRCFHGGWTRPSNGSGRQGFTCVKE